MFKKVGIVGAGSMGSAIAEVMAFNGIEVVLKDVNADLTERGVQNIRKIMESNAAFQTKRGEKEISRIESMGISLTGEQKETILKKLNPAFTRDEVNSALSRIMQTVSYSDFSDCELIIEAAFENQDVKSKIFREASENAPASAIIASNTSSISITALAKHAQHPENTIITHFFNPPYTLPLVEIVNGVQTSEDTFGRTFDFISKLKNHRTSMVPIRVKEVPGFLVNRILVPVMTEAAMALDEGVASKEDIDTAMKLGAGFPMGPLELSDMVGLDIVLDVQEILHRNYGDPKYRPSLLTRRLVEAGKLGRKTGEGYFSYRK